MVTASHSGLTHFRRIEINLDSGKYWLDVCRENTESHSLVFILSGSDDKTNTVVTTCVGLLENSDADQRLTTSVSSPLRLAEIKGDGPVLNSKLVFQFTKSHKIPGPESSLVASFLRGARMAGAAFARAVPHEVTELLHKLGSPETREAVTEAVMQERPSEEVIKVNGRPRRIHSYVKKPPVGGLFHE